MRRFVVLRRGKFATIFNKSFKTCVEVLGKDVQRNDIIYHEHRFLEVDRVESAGRNFVVIYFKPWDAPHNEERYFRTSIAKDASVFVDRTILED